MKTTIARCCAFLLLCVSQASMALQASFEPVANNTIYEDSPTYASGQSSNLFFGTIASGSSRRALLRFDVSSLPANAQLTSATLTLTTDRAARASDLTDQVSLHRVLASWGQGTSDAGSGGGGTQASAGDSTWNARFYNTPPATLSQAWSRPGGDFLAPASTAQALGLTLGRVTLASTQALVSDVQTWLGDASQNHGWIIRLAEGSEYKARRFYGRNAFAAEDRPILRVEYQLAPPVEVAPRQIPAVNIWAMIILALGILAIVRAKV